MILLTLLLSEVSPRKEDIIDLHLVGLIWQDSSICYISTGNWLSHTWRINWITTVCIFQILCDISSSPAAFLLFQADIAMADIDYSLIPSFKSWINSQRTILLLFFICASVLSLLIAALSHVLRSYGESVAFHIGARVYFFCPNRWTSTLFISTGSTVYNTFFDSSCRLDFVCDAPHCCILFYKWYLCFFKTSLHAYLVRHAMLHATIFESWVYCFETLLESDGQLRSERGVVVILGCWPVRILLLQRWLRWATSRIGKHSADVMPFGVRLFLRLLLCSLWFSHLIIIDCWWENRCRILLFKNCCLIHAHLL